MAQWCWPTFGARAGRPVADKIGTARKQFRTPFCILSGTGFGGYDRGGLAHRFPSNRPPVFRSFHPLTGECNGTCPHLCTQFTPQHADDLCHRRHHRRHRRRPLFTDVNELAGFPQGASLHNPLSGTAAWACSIRLISVSRIGRSDAGRRGLCGWVSSVAMSPRR